MDTLKTIWDAKCKLAASPASGSCEVESILKLNYDNSAASKSAKETIRDGTPTSEKTAALAAAGVAYKAW